MKLLVQRRGNKPSEPFHPRLLTRNGRWHAQYNKPTVYLPELPVRVATVENAIARYFAELRRMDYEVVQEAGFELKPPEVKS